MKDVGNENAIIVFVKNPILGKVKTRLANDFGEKKALEIYLKCIEITFSELKKVDDLDILIYYSDFIDTSFNYTWKSYVQQGDDLGERMKNAFNSVFELVYKKVLIIGSDLPYIKSAIIKEAIVNLDDNDFTIGPTFDGGYYLLGMKKKHPYIFENITWSTDDVYDSTINKIKKLNLKYKNLEIQRDLDDINDYIYFQKKGFFQKIR